MMARGVDHDSRPMKLHCRPKKTVHPFHAIPYAEIYVDEDSQIFWQRLDVIFGIFEGYKRHYNMAAWAECCFCFEKMSQMGTLGHPQSQVITIKDLIDREGIQSSEDFRRFMMRTLPKDKDGAILLPQVNMKHPSIKKSQESPSQPHSDTTLQKRFQEQLDELTDKVDHETEKSKMVKLCDDIPGLKRDVLELKVPMH